MKHRWTDTDKATLRALYPEFSAAECAAAIGCSVSSINNQAHALGLHKSREWIARRAAERSARPDHGGRVHQFRPGHATWNKGKPFSSGGRSVETRFKPGRPPSEARNYQPIGAVRISKDGYLERKVTDDNPIRARRWVAVHRLVWEDAHGPIPRGQIVRFRAGMHTTSESEITLDRLEMVTRAENMASNSIHNYPRPIKSLIRAVKRAERALENRSE